MYITSTSVYKKCKWERALMQVYATKKNAKMLFKLLSDWGGGEFG